MYPVKPFDIRYAVNVVEQITRRQLECLTGNSRIELLECLIDTLTAVTPQLITSSEQLYNTLWTDIRGNYPQHIVNYLLSGTSEMMMHFKSKGWDSNIVTNFFLETVPVTATADTAMDSPIKEQILIGGSHKLATDVSNLFKVNHWYVFIIILTMTDIRRSLIEAMQDLDKEKGKSK